MTKEARIAIVENAIRWTMNILVEVVNNHSAIIPSKTKQSLANVLSNLGDAAQNIREI